MLNEAYSPNNTAGILVANNSYGFDPLYLQTYQFGKYNSTAQNWDNLMYLRPYLQIVKAAGNSREIDPALVPQVTAKEDMIYLKEQELLKMFWWWLLLKRILI
jgi:hypothetical protein